jgi:uncharacterized HAD superfamily protein
VTERVLTLTEDEYSYLRSMVCAWIDDGFTAPPYDAEVYNLFAKLGIAQGDVTQYDITRHEKSARPALIDWRRVRHT